MSEHDPRQKQDDEPSLAAEETDHLKTEPGSEKVIPAKNEDKTEAHDSGRATSRYRRDPSGIEPRSVGRHPQDEVER